MKKLLITLCVFGIPAGFLSAQDFLDPLVITATRNIQKASDVPYTVDFLDSDFLFDTHRRTLPDALQYTPGVLVQRTGYGQGSPFIRGFTGRENVLLVDGVRINNSTWRSGPVQYWSTIDPFSVDRMELVKSQGSVLYGSDAVGGVLNVFTKSSRFREQEAGQFFSHGAASYEFRSNGRGSHMGRVESGFGVGGEYGLFFGLSAKDFGDIRGPKVGRMKKTGYTDLDFDFRFDYALNPDTTLTMAHQTVAQDDIWRWHRTVYNPGWVHGSHVAAPGTFLSNYFDQRRSLTYLKIESDRQGSFIDHWSATLSWQRSRDVETQLRTLKDHRWNEVTVNTYGLDLNFSSVLGPGTLTYGVDYYRDEVDASGSRNRVVSPANRTLADDASYDLFGTFAQYEWNLHQRLALTGGLRYTYAQAHWDRYLPAGSLIEQSGGNDWNNLSGSLRGRFKLADQWSLYGGVSQAFRSPNLSDLTGSRLALAAMDTQGSPDLSPEKYTTSELGVRHTSENLSFSAAGFYTWVREGISSVTMTDPVTGNPFSKPVNGKTGYVYGFETEVAWRFADGWLLHSGLGWNEGATKTAANGTRWLARQLPFSGTVALRWTRPDTRLWIEGRVLGAHGEGRIHPANQASDNQRVPTGGTPGYVVAMINSGYQLTDHIELNASLENLLNEDYRNHGSGQNEPGFGAILGARVSW